MADKRKKFDDDDGRTIADMSRLSHSSVFRVRVQQDAAAQKSAQDAQEIRQDRPWEDHSMSTQERRWFILGALKAALLIAGAFILGLGAVIAVILSAA